MLRMIAYKPIELVEDDELVVLFAFVGRVTLPSSPQQPIINDLTYRVQRLHNRSLSESSSSRPSIPSRELLLVAVDRPDVLDHLEGVVLHRFLFGPQRRRVGSREAVAVVDWRAAAEAAKASLGSPVTA